VRLTQPVPIVTNVLLDIMVTQLQDADHAHAHQSGTITQHHVSNSHFYTLHNFNASAQKGILDPGVKNVTTGTMESPE